MNFVVISVGKAVCAITIATTIGYLKGRYDESKDKNKD